MNNVGEQIYFGEIVKSCRTFEPKELLAVLKANINIFFSWGVSHPTVDNQKNTRMFRMNVRGHHHKGYVYIFLNGMDLYDVYLTDFADKIKMIQTDLYFDMLADWIDEAIEKVPAYRY